MASAAKRIYATFSKTCVVSRPRLAVSDHARIGDVLDLELNAATTVPIVGFKTTRQVQTALPRQQRLARRQIGAAPGDGPHRGAVGADQTAPNMAAVHGDRLTRLHPFQREQR